MSFLFIGFNFPKYTSIDYFSYLNKDKSIFLEIDSFCYYKYKHII